MYVTMVRTQFLTQFLLQRNIALRDNCDGNVRMCNETNRTFRLGVTAKIITPDIP